MDEILKEELWKEYQKSKSPGIREQLIIEYSSLVNVVAGRMSMHLGHLVEYDDLVGYGIFGLIDAIDKFELTKGVKFETYASLRIRGAILDQIRKMDWIPRTLRQKQKKMCIRDRDANKEVFLVLSATTKYKDLVKIAQTYSEITKYNLIFTKLDETETVGSLYNIHMLTGAPLSYATWGQNVPCLLYTSII